jgi:hypothetical protein
VFADACLQAQYSEVLHSVTGGCMVDAAFSDVLGSSLSATEPGSSGHGPRKEFFLLAGEDLVDRSHGEPELCISQCMLGSGSCPETPPHEHWVCVVAGMERAVCGN